MLSKASLTSYIAFAEFGHMTLLQTLIAGACTEASLPLFVGRRFFEGVAARQAMSYAAQRTAIRRCRLSAAFTCRRRRRRNLGAGQLRIRLGGADGAAHRTRVPFRQRTFVINEFEKLFKRQFLLVQRKVFNRFLTPFVS